MADIDRELTAIQTAVYGEEVRGSIHDGIKKINDAVEGVIIGQNLSIADIARKVDSWLFDTVGAAKGLTTSWEWLAKCFDPAEGIGAGIVGRIKNGVVTIQSNQYPFTGLVRGLHVDDDGNLEHWYFEETLSSDFPLEYAPFPVDYDGQLVLTPVRIPVTIRPVGSVVFGEKAGYLEFTYSEITGRCLVGLYVHDLFKNSTEKDLCVGDTVNQGKYYLYLNATYPIANVLDIHKTVDFTATFYDNSGQSADRPSSIDFVYAVDKPWSTNPEHTEISETIPSSTWSKSIDTIVFEDSDEEIVHPTYTIKSVTPPANYWPEIKDEHSIRLYHIGNSVRFRLMVLFDDNDNAAGYRPSSLRVTIMHEWTWVNPTTPDHDEDGGEGTPVDTDSPTVLSDSIDFSRNGARYTATGDKIFRHDYYISNVQLPEHYKVAYINNRTTAILSLA